MSKIEFRKVAKNDWLNIFAETGIKILIENGEFSNFEVARLNKMTKIFTREYLQNNYHTLINEFDLRSEEGEKLLRAFENFVSLSNNPKKVVKK